MTQSANVEHDEFLMNQENAQSYLDSLPQLKEGQTFCFECNPEVACFNRCCRQLTLPLTPYDVLRLRTRLQMASADFFDAFAKLKSFPDSGMPIVMLRMLTDPDETCPFVTPAGCHVYEDRPGACRSYPLGRGTTIGTNGVSEVHYLVQEAHCHGFDDGRDWTAQEWFEQQGLVPYNQANDRYMRLSAMVAATGTPLDTRLGNMCFLACYQLDKFTEFIEKMKIFTRVELSTERQEAIMQGGEATLDFALDWMELIIFGQCQGLQKKR